MKKNKKKMLNKLIKNNRVVVKFFENNIFII